MLLIAAVPPQAFFSQQVVCNVSKAFFGKVWRSGFFKPLNKAK
jgi:hypothetical protein